MAYKNCNLSSPVAKPFFSMAGFILALFLCLPFWSDQVTCESVRRTYIVHVEKPPPDHGGSHRDWHETFLSQLGDVGGQLTTDSRLLYSYTNVMSGFAVRLTEEELETMKNMDGFLHAVPDQHHTSFHTTHTPNFLGLYPGRDTFWESVAGYGRGVIIGVIDSGIDPTHPSFNDAGMDPPPPRWKGKCEFHDPSLCNNKIIGARLFDSQNQTSDREPFDKFGHGTHTGSIAAGRLVPDANLLGSARGTAAGVAPDAWIAVYKLGHGDGESGGGISDSDIMAAIDTAVEDGVDVISFSMGSTALRPFYDASTAAIATFGAIRKGVFVSAAAGNKGPSMGTLENIAPWILTVGASTMDRRIRSVVMLGNGEELEGQSAYQPTNFTTSSLPLVDGSPCHNLTRLQTLDVRGKLVICNAELETLSDIETGKVVLEAGGAGMIYINPKRRGLITDVRSYFIPASCLTSFDKNRIDAYMIQARLEGSVPTASILFKGTEIGSGVSLSAPSVASFSSRGPSIVNPGILKPDIIGPGVNILAAYHKPVGPYFSKPAFNIFSGTSMSCPHLSGVAALLKSTHPNWSPAMIKSAMMTTADLRNLKGTPITDSTENRRADFFATGSGHVNPVRANNPGLVYDIQIRDYVSHLCGLGYTDKQVSIITMERTSCSAYNSMSESDLNYPSLTVDLSSQAMKQVARTVINVGEPYSSYKVNIIRPPGVLVTIQPEILYFTEIGQQQNFVVVFEASRTEAPPSWFSEGLLSWVSFDGKITVNSPISVRFGNPSL